ncbi:hypothetical protein TNCT_586031, partial [Trichonephila clavata]
YSDYFFTKAFGHIRSLLKLVPQGLSLELKLRAINEFLSIASETTLLKGHSSHHMNTENTPRKAHTQWKMYQTLGNGDYYSKLKSNTTET